MNEKFDVCDILGRGVCDVFNKLSERTDTLENLTAALVKEVMNTNSRIGKCFGFTVVILAIHSAAEALSYYRINKLEEEVTTLKKSDKINKEDIIDE